MKKSSSYYKQKELFLKYPLIGIGVGFAYGGLTLFIFSFLAALIDAKIANRLLVAALICIVISLIFVIIGMIKKNNKDKQYTKYYNYNVQNYELPSSLQLEATPRLKYYKKSKNRMFEQKNYNGFSNTTSASLNNNTVDVNNTSDTQNIVKKNKPIQSNVYTTINQKLNAATAIIETDKIIADYVGVVVSSNSLNEKTETNLAAAIKFVHKRKKITFAELKSGLNLDDEQCQKTLNLLVNLKIIEKALVSENCIIWEVSNKNWEILLPVDMPTNNADIELEKIDGMSEDGVKFEQYVANLLLLNGFATTELTPVSNDYGVDVVATDRIGIRYAIQCKCYNNKLGNSCIQEVIGGKSYYHCQVGAVITNNYFTKNAKKLAEVNGIILWDRDKLTKFIQNIL